MKNRMNKILNWKNEYPNLVVEERILENRRNELKRLKSMKDQDQDQNQKQTNDAYNSNNPYYDEVMDENEDMELRYDTETQNIATSLAVAGTKTVNIDRTKTNINTKTNQNQNQKQNLTPGNLGNLTQELSVSQINP